MFGSVPAELVWFVGPASEAYDCLLYRAMTAELWLCFALSGADPKSGLWYSDRFRETHDVWARAAKLLVGQEGMT